METLDLQAALAYYFFSPPEPKILILRDLQDGAVIGLPQNLSRLDLHVKYCRITTYVPPSVLGPLPLGLAMMEHCFCGKQGQMSHGLSISLWITRRQNVEGHDLVAPPSTNVLVSVVEASETANYGANGNPSRDSGSSYVRSFTTSRIESNASARTAGG